VPNKHASEASAQVWIFDLDNTLHDAGAHVFPYLSRSMTQYLMTHLDLGELQAGELRQLYWRKYGATLHGLIRHHGTDPRHFLHHTHQFPELQNMVIRASGLRAALLRLKGHKVIFTNAPLGYAERVLRLLKIRDLFQAVFSIESTRFQPKPATQGFMRLLHAMKTPARRCVMVEDSLPALRTAKKLGMKTVYINPHPRRPSYVDVRIPSVLALPKIAATF